MVKILKLKLFEFFYFEQGNNKSKNNNKVGGDKIKKFPFDKQENIKDCGASCLSMIIKYYGGYLNIEKIRELVNVGKDGTSAYHIIEGAKKIGFEAKGYECPLDKFETEKVNFPLIANVVINKSFTHFVVIYDINYRKKEIFVADPADKLKKISFDSFNLIYNGFILLLYPKAKIPFMNKTTINWSDFFPLVYHNKSFFINIFFLSTFVIIYSVVISFYSQILLDNLFLEINYLTCLFVFFLIITIIKITSEHFRNIIFIYITQRMELMITTDSFNKILSLPYSYYRNHSTGDILARIKDITIIRDTLSKWIMIWIVDLPLMLISFIILFKINYSLALITLIIFFLYWIILKIFHHPLENVITKCHKENSTLTSNQIEAINAFETIKGLSIKEKIRANIDNQENIFLTSLHKFQKISILENYFKELIENGGYLVIFYLGCCAVNKETMTLGVLLTFQSLMNYFLTPVRELVDLDADTKNMNKAIIRLKELFIEEKRIGYLNIPMNGDIEFKNLSYTYNKTTTILKNINLTIKRGEKVLLIGKSGSGKSTLLKLLKKYYSVKRNCIKIGDKDINDYQSSKDIIYINQIEFLFTDSLYNNITLNDKIDSKKLNDIFILCEIDDIIKNNNLGYFMLIEENGFNLSGGERQRIALARALIRPFNILIIDEGLSQVDTDMERRILKKIFMRYKNKTIIVISHRLDNGDLFNHHVQIKDGCIYKDVIRHG